MNADAPMEFEARRVWAKERFEQARDRMNRAYAIDRDHDIEAVKAEAATRGETPADWEVVLRVDARRKLRQDSYREAYLNAQALTSQLDHIAWRRAKQAAADLAAAAAKRGELWKLPDLQPRVPAQQHHREGR